MSEEYFHFMAEDAFVYVDTYRKAIEWPPEKISQKMAWLASKVNDEESKEEYDSKVYAEYRGYVDALKFATDRQEPGFVFLGKDSDAKKSTPGEGEKMSAEDEVEMLRERVRNLREEVVTHKKAKVDMDGDLARCRNELNSTNHKLSNCQGLQYVLLAVAGAFFILTLFMVILK